MNKRGDAGDWVDFGGFAFILIIIVGGVVGGYLSFFG